MGAGLLVEENLEDVSAEVWLMLLLFELTVEDVRALDEVLLVLLLFRLVCKESWWRFRWCYYSLR